MNWRVIEGHLKLVFINILKLSCKLIAFRPGNGFEPKAEMFDKVIK